MIREFSVELTGDDAEAIARAAITAGAPAIEVQVRPGRKTFAFDADALTSIADGDFTRFLWSAFDRVETNGDLITLSAGGRFTFCLPVSKLQDPEIRRAIWDFVSGRVGLDA